MDNYPPGVTGREPQIAGYDSEEDAYRDCGSPGTLSVITRHGMDEIRRIKSLLVEIALGDKPASLATTLVANLDYLLKYDIEHIDVAVCPFEGDVVICWYGTEGTWQCPMCQQDHKEHAPEPDDNWYKD